MGHCHAALLADPAPSSESAGADARKFLQGLLTNDIGKARGRSGHPCRPA